MTNEDALVVYKRIPVASLYVPHDYQRELRERWVTNRIDKFSEYKLGTLTVVSGDNGHYAVVDGQHRVALIRAVTEAGGEAPSSAWCEVRQEKNRAAEAELFLGRNDTQTVPPLDKFRARIIAGELQANAIKDILLRHGVAIGRQQSEDSSNYACVTTIEGLYVTDDLDAVIEIIERSWARTFGKMARTEVVVKGVGVFHATYKTYKQYSTEKAVEEFGAVDNFASFIKRARADALVKDISVPSAIALMLLPRYNKGLRTNSLPSGKLEY
jgi:hypothetical protein